MSTLTYGFGVALAGFAGVLAAPIYSVNPLMGSSLVIVVFAVDVIGCLGSILGDVVTGFGLVLVDALFKMFYPEASAKVIFLVSRSEEHTAAIQSPMRILSDRPRVTTNTNLCRQ